MGGSVSECNSASLFAGCQVLNLYKGIKPDKDNPLSGEITLNGNPTRLERHERYHFDKERDMFVTDNYDIPTYFITKFLEENDCLVEQDDKVYVAFKEVVFKSNY